MNPIIAGSIVANALKKKKTIKKKNDEGIEEEEYAIIYKSINRIDTQKMIKIQDYDKKSAMTRLLLLELDNYLLKIPEKEILQPGHLKHVMNVMEKVLSSLDFQVFYAMLERIAK